MANIVTDKVSPLVKNVKKYWKEPPKGRYMPFKEIVSLAFGGIGIKFIVYCVNNMLLATTNKFIANTIGMEQHTIYIIYVLSIISSYPLTILRANIIDNTRNMKGKYRPYILTMAIPTVILGLGFVWMPYENMNTVTQCVVILAFNIGFQFFYNFMNDSYESLLNVLSPNTYERSDVSAVKAIVENLAPSIVSIALPMVANLITGDNNLYQFAVYRYIYPVLLVLGLVVSLPIYLNTREKIVQAKTHVIQIKFSDALRAVARNKYFWIISLAGWLGFLESSFSNIIEWMYVYQNACSAAQYSLIIAISSNASFWPNLFTPLLIRRYGKRNILIFTNMLSIVFIAVMLPVVRMQSSSYMIWIMMLCIFLNSFITAMGSFLNPSIQADIRDYQQYITGERIDGMFAAVGLIGSTITMLTNSVLPYIYEKSGLNSETAASLGYSNPYDVLYNHEYFVSTCTVILIASAIGAALNVIPYFFYDLTEVKQRSMVSVLKIRAMFEDYGNGQLNDDSLAEAVEIIETSKKNADLDMIKIDRKAVKKIKDKTARKQAKKQLKADIETNNNIMISKYVLAEINKFNTPEGQVQVENAQKMVNAGLNGFMNEDTLTIAQVKAMPKDTAEQKEQRSEAISNVRNFKTAKKTIAKYFPNGIKEFDASVFDMLFKLEDENEADLRRISLEIKTKKENNNKSNLDELKKEFKLLKQRKKKVTDEIKKATDENSVYHRAAKPYLDAVKLLAYKENLAHYDEILEKYSSAKES
ncbi:MAG: MFS transporter [Clostridiales bacterium]|nr:MFS transporter [Clostridiales bacterium]